MRHIDIIENGGISEIGIFELTNIIRQNQEFWVNGNKVYTGDLMVNVNDTDIFIKANITVVTIGQR